MTEPAPKPPARRLFLVRRVLPLVVLLALAAWYFRDAPRDVTVAIDLAARREGLTALKLDLWHVPGHELARHVEYHFANGYPAPQQQRIATRLEPGEYQVDLFLEYGPRSERIERRLKLEKQEELAIAP